MWELQMFPKLMNLHSALAEHLKLDHNLATVEEFNSNFKFTVLEDNPWNLDFSEQRWISRMVTMRSISWSIGR